MLVHFELFMAFLYSPAKGLSDDLTSVSTFINKHLFLTPILHSCGCNYLVQPYRVLFRGPISLRPTANSDYLYSLGPDLTMSSHCKSSPSWFIL